MFEKILVSEYFKYGSINKVFQRHHYDLPISFASFARLLDKYKVVKTTGPSSSISESFYIMSLLANYKVSLERIYRSIAPKSIQVSINTLHRVLHFTRLGLTRRQGAILIISTKNNPEKVLLGNDISLSNVSIRGKKGDLTLPMGHTKLNESIHDSIVRILQKEVFTKSTIEGKFPWSMIPKHLKPLMFINITDIHVSVYKLVLPSNPPKFFSYKLANLKLVDIGSIDFERARPGIKEVLEYYCNPFKLNNKAIDSDLNREIFALAKELVE